MSDERLALFVVGGISYPNGKTGVILGEDLLHHIISDEFSFIERLKDRIRNGLPLAT
jgi:hypothetical protein